MDLQGQIASRAGLLKKEIDETKPTIQGLLDTHRNKFDAQLVGLKNSDTAITKRITEHLELIYAIGFRIEAMEQYHGISFNELTRQYEKDSTRKEREAAYK
jgi:hypothetical protein